MNTLAQKLLEVWNEHKGAYPEGEQVKAADDLAGFFMEESIRLDLGEDFNPLMVSMNDVLADSDPFAL